MMMTDNIIKMDPKALARRKEFVGKWANYWLGGKYYHQAEIVEFVPAGKLPLKKYRKLIIEGDAQAPEIRNYDSLVVRLTDGSFRYPPLDAHREVGVI